MECRMVLRVLALTLAVGLVAGCGESEKPKVKTVAVSGIVYLDGSPLAGCAVHFTHGPDHAGIGSTDSSGKYELQAEPGENRVVFSKSEGSGLTDEEAEMAEMGDAAGADPEEDDDEPEEGQVIPAKYRDPDQTDQKFNVPEEGATNADFKLTTE